MDANWDLMNFRAPHTRAESKTFLVVCCSWIKPLSIVYRNLNDICLRRNASSCWKFIWYWDASIQLSLKKKCKKKNPDHLYKMKNKSRIKADYQALSGIPDNLISDKQISLTSLNACLKRYRDREYHRKLSSRSYAALENMLTIWYWIVDLKCCIWIPNAQFRLKCSLTQY